MIELTKGTHRVGLLPETGGSIAYWKVNDADILSPVADERLAAFEGQAVAAYPLVPYSGRIAGAGFSFEGQDYALTPNFGGESNAIHGNGWSHAWTVAQQDPDRAILLFDHTPDTEERAREWPFAYRCVMSFVLHDDGLSVEMVVVNRDEKPQPVGFGFHPFFVKGAAATLGFKARGVWENGAGQVPTTHLLLDDDAGLRWSFEKARDLKDASVDNCFSGWDGEAELAEREAEFSVRIEADPVFQHLVVYTAPDKPFVAVEPVTNMGDAIHHSEVMERGLHVLAPGGRVNGTIRFRIVDRRG